MTDESLFREALARPDPHERAAFLDEACAGKSQLRAAVEALLAAHETAPGSPPMPLSRPPATGDYAPEPEAVSTTAESPRATADPLAAADVVVVAGRYTLAEKIGEGGMGDVWVAQQTEPVKRQVALKLIKAGMDTQAVLPRFEQERQALALMDHPNIARVFDGGMTADRRPFFVMELVNGLPLTRFCDEAKLGVREPAGTVRAGLPGRAARPPEGHHPPRPQAVEHPGRRLIDGKPVPKVIDFGVAKATGRQAHGRGAVHAVRGRHRHAGVHGAGAGGLSGRRHRHAGGHLFAGRDPVRAAHRPAPIDGRRLRKAALPEMVRIIQRGGAAEAVHAGCPRRPRRRRWRRCGRRSRESWRRCCAASWTGS